MTLRRYTVHRINTFSIAKFGCILGSLAMLLPGILCAVASGQIIAALRTIAESWQASEVDPLGLGTPIEFDFVNLFGLAEMQALLIRLDEQRLTVMLLIILSSIIGGGLLIAVTILLVGWGYNLLAMMTGGLEVELRERAER